MRKPKLERINYEVLGMSEEAHRVLKAIAGIRGIKLTEVIRLALEEYAARHDPRRKETRALDPSYQPIEHACVDADSAGLPIERHGAQ